MRKTFSPDKRNEILTYIKKFDEKHGRGGQSAAARKFKVSRVAINHWLKPAAPAVQLQSQRGRMGGSVAPKEYMQTIDKSLSAFTSLGKTIDKFRRALEQEKAKISSKFKRG
jgi:hypothetical protein